MSFSQHEACPQCGSENNLGRYSDGSAWCFGANCDYYEYSSDYLNGDRSYAGEATDTDTPHNWSQVTNFLTVDPAGGIPARGISEDTCEKMRYGWGSHVATIQLIQVANIYENGKLVAQKTRDQNKKFTFIGGPTDALFGTFKGGARQIVVTEGELDALSFAEVDQCKWPVVSVTKGAAGAVKQIAANIESFAPYERVVFAFDADPPGQEAAKACAALIAPGKAFIATFPNPHKDANDMLMAGLGKELPGIAWAAKEYRPDGIISGLDLIDKVVEIPEPGLSYPWPTLTHRLYGQRLGEIVMWTAGTGSGKTTAVRQNAYHLAFSHGKKVGYIGLEETPDTAARQLVGMYMGKLLHIPTVRATMEAGEIREAAEEILERFEFYSHEGTFDWPSLEAKIRYWRHSVGIEWFVLDHVSFVLSAGGGGNTETDVLMTHLRLLVENLHIHVDVISHLRKVGSGEKSFEEGAPISSDDLRGSGTLKQVPNVILAMERNQQAPGEPTKIRGLKDRFTGQGVGVLVRLGYDTETGRYHEEVDETVAEAFVSSLQTKAELDTTLARIRDEASGQVGF